MLIVTEIKQADPVITKQSVLREALDREEHNLMCYSANILMTEPKQGFEQEYIRTAKKIIMLREIMEDVR